MAVEPESDKVFRVARWKAAWRLIGSLAFLFFTVYLFRLDPQAYPPRMPQELVTRTFAVLGGLFFGVNGALSFANLMDPSRLVLTAAGFRVEGPSVRKLVRWSEVEEFFISETRLSRLIYYRLRSGPTRNLPGWYKADPDAVVSALNRWLKAYGPAEPAPSRRQS